MCAADLSGGPAYLVFGSLRHGRRRDFARFLICEPCYVKGAPDPSGLSRPDDARRTKNAWWVDLVGRGAVLPSGPCVACGLVVVRRAERLLKGVTCSRACRTSLTRIRSGGKGSGRPCGHCGRTVTAGRADSVYCGSPCRQKAYRGRVATVPDPIVELRDAMAPFVTRYTPGISQSLYKALYRLHVSDRYGPEAQERALVGLAAMNPERIMMPDTDIGRRLRAALCSNRDRHA